MLDISNLSKSFFVSNHEISVLSNINLAINNNETVALKGPSGSGKTTLLNLITGIDQVSSGKILFENHDITLMDQANLSKFRRDNLGIVFQFFNLINDLSVFENVMLPLALMNLNLHFSEPLLMEHLEHHFQYNRRHLR